MNNEAKRLKAASTGKAPRLPGEVIEERLLDTPEGEKSSPNAKSESEKMYGESRLTRNALRRSNSTPSTPKEHSPLSSSRGERIPQKLRSSDKLLEPMIQKAENPTVKTPSPMNEPISPQRSPKPIVITFGPKSPSPSPGCRNTPSPVQSVVRSPNAETTLPRRRRSARTIPQAELPQLVRADLVEVTVASIMSGFKPFKLLLQKTATVRALKTGVRSRTKVRNFTLLFDGKELGPDDSLISSHGITDGATINVQVKTQAGTSDREDIANLLRLSQSLQNLTGMLSAMPLMITAGPGNTSSTKSSVSERNSAEVSPVANKELENMKTRKKMDEIRRMKKQLNPNSPLCVDPKKKVKEKGKAKSPRVRSPGSIVTSPRSVLFTSIVSPVDEMEDAKTKKVTQKELLLYFDPPESYEMMATMTTELFEPPESRAMLEKLKLEMANSRCGMCRARLRLAARAIVCKCQKVFCPNHRNPESHRCSVDFKQVGRQHMHKEFRKPTPEHPKSKG